MKYFTLQNSWDWCWGELTGTENELLRDTILWRYNEPIRKYHALPHLEGMLFNFYNYVGDTLAGKYSREKINIIALAIWFHDSVYDPKKDDNEIQSAILVETELLKAKVHESVISEVIRLILATSLTQHNRKVSDLSKDEMLIQDLDLITLGLSQTAFLRYSHQIREEYAHVPEADYIKGRIAVLEGILNKDAIYRVPTFQKTYESGARSNLTIELLSLYDGLERCQTT